MSDPVAIALIAAISSTIAGAFALAATIIGLNNSRKTDALHKLVNSNLTTQIDASKSASRAEGREEGRVAGTTEERLRSAETKKS